MKIFPSISNSIIKFRYRKNKDIITILFLLKPKSTRVLYQIFRKNMGTNLLNNSNERIPFNNKYYYRKINYKNYTIYNLYTKTNASINKNKDKKTIKHKENSNYHNNKTKNKNKCTKNTLTTSLFKRKNANKNKQKEIKIKKSIISNLVLIRDKLFILSHPQRKINLTQDSLNSITLTLEKELYFTKTLINTIRSQNNSI